MGNCTWSWDVQNKKMLLDSYVKSRNFIFSSYCLYEDIRDVYVRHVERGERVCSRTRTTTLLLSGAWSSPPPYSSAPSAVPGTERRRETFRRVLFLGVSETSQGFLFSYDDRFALSVSLMVIDLEFYFQNLECSETLKMFCDWVFSSLAYLYYIFSAILSSAVM